MAWASRITPCGLSRYDTLGNSTVSFIGLLWARSIYAQMLAQVEAALSELGRRPLDDDVPAVEDDDVVGDVEAERRDGLGCAPGDGSTVDGDGASSGRQQTDRHVHRGRFAGAVASEQPEQTPFTETEGHPVQHVAVAVEGVDLVQRERGRRQGGHYTALPRFSDFLMPTGGLLRIAPERWTTRMRARSIGEGLQNW